MKLTILKPVEINIKYIVLDLPVRYDEDDMPNDFPFRENDRWKVTVDIDTGIIQNWPFGISHELYMKVTDEGIYTILDENKNVLSTRDYYVPNCIPNDYSDYVDLNINSEGKITNWLSTEDMDFSQFFDIKED